MKRLGVLPLPPGWDASSSQDYPQHFLRFPNGGWSFIHLGGEKQHGASFLESVMMSQGVMISCITYLTVGPVSAQESVSLTARER